MATRAVQTWHDTAASHVKSCFHTLTSHLRGGGTGKRSGLMMLPLPACCPCAYSQPPRSCLFRIMVFLLLFSVLATWLHYSVLPKTTRHYNDECYLTEEQLGRMRFVLRQVVEFLNEENATYWLDYGTLLGAIREGDIIPHDHDIDLSRVADDAERDDQMISRLKYKMSPLGFRINATKVLYKDVQMDIFRWRSFKTSAGETLFYKYYGYDSGTFFAENIANNLFPPVTDPKELFPFTKFDYVWSDGKDSQQDSGLSEKEKPSDLVVQECSFQVEVLCGGIMVMR